MTVTAWTPPTPHPTTAAPRWRRAVTRVLDAADHGRTAALDWLDEHDAPWEKPLDWLQDRVVLRPFEKARARARLQVRAYSFDTGNRADRLSAWAATTEALASTQRALSSYTQTADEHDRITHLVHQAALLRAIAETERVRHATRYTAAHRRTPAVPDIETVASAQLDRLCLPSIDTAGRRALLRELEALLYPRLGAAVRILHALS